jgi:hypothetical protein
LRVNGFFSGKFAGKLGIGEMTFAWSSRGKIFGTKLFFIHPTFVPVLKPKF